MFTLTTAENKRKSNTLVGYGKTGNEKPPCSSLRQANVSVSPKAGNKQQPHSQGKRIKYFALNALILRATFPLNCPRQVGLERCNNVLSVLCVYPDTIQERR